MHKWTQKKQTSCQWNHFVHFCMTERRYEKSTTKTLTIMLFQRKKLRYFILFLFHSTFCQKDKTKKAKNISNFKLTHFHKNRIKHALNIKSVKLYTLIIWIDNKIDVLFFILLIVINSHQNMLTNKFFYISRCVENEKWILLLLNIPIFQIFNIIQK